MDNLANDNQPSRFDNRQSAAGEDRPNTQHPTSDIGADSPIGIFDSGVGGLTVFRALERRLPNESLIYLGDTARVPYGTRSPETVERYAIEDAGFIRSKNVKVIVIACNTVSATAANRLREVCDVPVIGVVRAGARRAVAATRSGYVGVIATEGTVASGAYERAMLSLNARLEVISRACPLFVPLAEEGWVRHPVTRQVAEEYLADMRASRVDTLVLGCTHYPILRPLIDEVMGDHISFIDSGEAVADEVARLLEERNLVRRGGEPRSEQFYVTDAAVRFRRVAELFLGRPLESVETVELGTI
ncbi:MAG TPA: glutamate racemase [Blastocatellia bacterium]|nr:glutamate racemase [Blastocatellia bacterium]